MSLFHAVVLALVQGLTEFLPVSSTAHLYLFPWLLGWPDGGIAFDAALHAGTLVAVLFFYLRTWVLLLLNGVGVRFPADATEEEFRGNRRLFWLLVAGTIPAGIVGLVFEGVIERWLRNPLPIAIALIAGGLLMALVDAAPGLLRTLKGINLSDSLAIGTAQALALIPGVSRSGITITAGLWRKLTRETAAEFSFLLSTPVIAAAAIKEIPRLIRMQQAGTIDLAPSTLLIAIAVSGLVGYGVIAFFLRYLQTRTLKIFIVYRISFGIVILLLLFLHRGTAR